MLRKILKIAGISLLSLTLLAGIAISVFIYKVKNGLPIYESNPPEISRNLKETSILVFSKTNGFRHGGAIKEAIHAFQTIADHNDWSVFTTESGGVFNPEQLALFDVVIWNNVTGRVLKDEQREAFQSYIENGGGFIGIHGAGDFSHHWDWYQKELIGASFSHHTMDSHTPEAGMYLECDTLFPICRNLPTKWVRSDEWYTFLDNPRDKGFNILWTVDENNFNPGGNMGFLVKDKDFGMGEDHPLVWYKCVGEGRTFYSALGHAADAFKEEVHLQMLEGAIRWAGKLEGGCK